MRTTDQRTSRPGDAAGIFALVVGGVYLLVALAEGVIGIDGWRIGGTYILQPVAPHTVIQWSLGLVLIGSFFAGGAAARLVLGAAAVILLAVSIWGFLDRTSLGHILGHEGALPWSYQVIHLATALLAVFALLAAYGHRSG